MAEALAVLLRLLVVSTIVERFLEIASQVWDYVAIHVGGRKAPAGRKRLVLQSAGVVLGVILSSLMGIVVFRMLGIGGIPYWLDVLFTGILVGGGTEPVHQLISFLNENKQRVKRRLEAQRREEGQPETTVPEEESTGIAYRGGLYPDRPGHGLRRKNPSLVVFHHSATHSDTTFQRIVELEKERDLDPSYHCVVTADGVYHNYCRWDSIGWHARGVNARSLGVCLVGNFETNPSVPGNNADGRFGNRTPTEKQLDTAARVVALWRLLYGIDADQVVPHRKVRRTACPGSNFPEEAFLRRVQAYVDQWQNAPGVLAEIEELKESQAVYV